MHHAQTERPYRSHRHPACLSCRKRKSRCKTRDAPGCIMCQVHGTECVFPEERASRAKRCLRRSATTRNLRPRPQIPPMLNDGQTRPESIHQVNLATLLENTHSETTQSQNQNDELSDIMGLDVEANPDNAHIVSPAVADDNSILETYLSPLPGSRRRVFRPTANGARPVLFNTVQRRPLGVSCNQSLASSKCQIIEKLIESHEHDLIDLFFTHFNPCFPLFDESSFRKTYRNHRHKVSPALLSNLYANVLIYWDCSPRLQGTRPPDGRFIWVLACEALHSEMFLAPGMSTVLAIILNVCGRPSTSVFGNGGLMGMAVSLSHALGLNRDPSGWDISPAEKAFRVRIWWLVVVQERWCSLAYGTPLQIHRSQYDVPLPSCISEQDPLSASQIFIFLASLTEVLGKSLEHVYSVEADSSTSLQSPARLLTDWENALPPELKHSILDNNNTNLHHPGAANLRLAYLAVTLLHRRIQLNLCTELSSSTEQYSAAHSAAESIVHFVQRLHETPFPGFWIPMNAYALTSATTFLLRSALHGSSVSLQLARQIVRALRELRDRHGWDLADHCLGQCAEVLDRVESVAGGTMCGEVLDEWTGPSLEELLEVVDGEGLFGWDLGFDV